MSVGRLFVLFVSAAALVLPGQVFAKSFSRSSGSTTTHYSKGKPAGKSVTHGNTTRNYVKGKPVGKSIRH